MSQETNERIDPGSPFRGVGGVGRIIIAGGGTGGHIFPALAIANALKAACPEVEILFIGAKGKMEMEKIPEAGYKIAGLDIAGLNRSSLIKNIGLPFKLVNSFIQVRKIFKKFRPTAVVGVGGYSSFPVLRYAQSKGIPSFIHESNSFAGKANMLLGRKATRIFVAADGMEKFFPAGRIILTGNPIRAEISANKDSRDAGIMSFGLDPEKITILCIGGSLGAKSINEALDHNLEEFEKNDLQLIWQTGKPFAVRAKQRAAGKKYIWVNDFITNMQLAYAAGDMVISRSGAMAIAELSTVRKPVIFVPFPYAAEDHQTVNAQSLVNKNACIMIKDDEALDKLVPAVIALSKNRQKQNELRENISKLAIVNADKMIASEILKCIR